MIKNGISDSVAMLTALAIIILGIILIMFIVPESILDRVFGWMRNPTDDITSAHKHNITKLYVS